MSWQDAMTTTGAGSCLLLLAAVGVCVWLTWQGRGPRP